jgi:hypothetical protein
MVLSPAYWLNLEKPERRGLLSVYISFWLTALAMILAFGPSGSGWLSNLVLGITAYRLHDFFFSTIEEALNLTGRFESLRKEEYWKAPVVHVLVNVVQVILVFAIAIFILTTSTDWEPLSTKVPFGRVGALFLSWNSVAAFGVRSDPASSRAFWLAMVESAVFAMVILIALTRFLTGAGRPARERSEQTGTARTYESAREEGARTGERDCSEVVVDMSRPTPKR